MAENSDSKVLETKEFPTEIQGYLNSIKKDEKREDVLFYLNYMRENHPDITPVISYGIPTYKLSGKRRYIAFSNAINHYTFHSTDFDVIDELREKIKGSGKGKGSVQLKYGVIEYRELILDAMERIINR